MSALETTDLPGAVARHRGPTISRALVGRVVPLAVPVALAVAYLVLPVVRYPQIIAWQNADSDVASSYVLASAIAHGHVGQIQLSTQGTWLELA